MKIVEIIIAKPMKSVGIKAVLSHSAEITVAETGSILETMLAFDAPIR